MRVIVAVLSIAGANAYSSHNQPLAPGNENFPSASGQFQGELEHGLPSINVKYRFSQSAQDPAAVMHAAEDGLAFSRRLQDDFAAASQDAANLKMMSRGSFAQDPFSAAAGAAGVSEGTSQYDDMSSLFQGLKHSPRPGSFVQIVGDEVPRPMPVINIGVEEPAATYGSDNAQKLVALRNLVDSNAATAHSLMARHSGKSFVEAEAPMLDKEQITAIQEKLLKDSCGAPCQQYFDSMLKAVEKGDYQDWSKALKAGAQQAISNSENVKAEAKSLSKLASFAKSKSFPDAPCTDAASCKAVEIASSRCSYGRVGTLATYQALNIPVHVFAIIQSVVCGCVNVASASFCVFQSGTFPPCTFFYSVYSKLLAGSKQAWEAVKGSTASCKMFGFPLIASQP